MINYLLGILTGVLLLFLTIWFLYGANQNK